MIFDFREFAKPVVTKERFIAETRHIINRNVVKYQILIFYLFIWEMINWFSVFSPEPKFCGPSQLLSLRAFPVPSIACFIAWFTRHIRRRSEKFCESREICGRKLIFLSTSDKSESRSAQQHATCSLRGRKIKNFTFNWIKNIFNWNWSEKKKKNFD